MNVTATLETLKVSELRQLAAGARVPRRSSMRKAELIAALAEVPTIEVTLALELGGAVVPAPRLTEDQAARFAQLGAHSRGEAPAPQAEADRRASLAIATDSPYPAPRPAPRAEVRRELTSPADRAVGIRRFTSLANAEAATPPSSRARAEAAAPADGSHVEFRGSRWIVAGRTPAGSLNLERADRFVTLVRPADFAEVQLTGPATLAEWEAELADAARARRDSATPTELGWARRRWMAANLRVAVLRAAS